MKANDVMSIFELGKTFAKAEKPRRRKPKSFDYDLSELDLSLLLQKKLQEAATIEKFMKDHHTAHKKEEQKKEGWTVNHLAWVLVFTFPITAPIYVAYIRSVIH